MGNIINVKNPKLLLLVYDDNSIECRPIKKDGTVAAAKRFYQKTINKIFKNMSGEIVTWEFKERISDKVLYVNNNKEVIVWYQKPCVKKLVFNTDKYNGEYALPMLIFKISKGKLNVIATKGISDENKAYVAPFNNLYANAICLGNASLKLDKYQFYEDIIHHAKVQFYTSRFTGAPDQKLKNKGAKVFDVNKLKTHKSFKNVREFIYDKNS